MVKNEVFLEGQSKAIQGDLLDTWIFRERSMVYILEVLKGEGGGNRGVFRGE